MAEREQWGSQFGFVLATIGSAVGIGNIWRFPYVAGENGGGGFLLVYILCVLLIGLPLVIAELAVGRAARLDTISAFPALAPRSPLRRTGWVAVIAGTVILSFYAVVAGWTFRYFVSAVSGSLWEAGETGFAGYFSGFTGRTAEPLLWQAAAVLLAGLVVARGVQSGIERLNKWAMPVLAAIMIALAFYGLLRSDGTAGLEYLFRIDPETFTRPGVYIAALGQAFFSIGIGMAIFVTYGSYMQPETPILKSALFIVSGDTLFAVFAGIAIFPAVFAHGLDPASGPDLAFVALPRVFSEITGGAMLAVAFFFLLAAAGLTSMISILEVPVAVCMDRFGLSRTAAATIMCLLIFALGLVPGLGFSLLKDVRIAGEDLFGIFDHIASSVLLPLSGICVSLFVGWSLHRRDALVFSGLRERLGISWIWLLRIIVPLLVALVLLNGLVEL
ncbi:sodium-dependent transporter [Nisaea acidiphila]|uniref:Transporter n=1 Tax=Nisaea acidiphila TaxID=1862145 RepID=A0A9J7AV07_9PROT|nr:sodium-dependent transporter [Nisaea acidiphila]UUX50297.1 sodium-dependent transporter [Nisaea acidiphila]